MPQEKSAITKELFPGLSSPGSEEAHQAWENLHNPHLCLPEMQRLANSAATVDVKALRASFETYLLTASHEEWQLTIEHLWDKCLAPVNLSILRLVAQLIPLGYTLHKDEATMRAVRGLGAAANLSPPDEAHFVSFDARYSGVSRKSLLEVLVEGMCWLVKKRMLLQKHEAALKEWLNEAKGQGHDVEQWMTGVLGEGDS